MAYSPSRRVIGVCLGTAIVLAATSLSAIAAECRMAQAFKQRDGNAKNGVTSVWGDANSSSLFFIEKLNVNTDGTKRSYSVEDFGGETSALNNLCNAMSDGCAGLSKEGLKQRRILTQQASAEGWPSDKLKSSKIASSIIPFKNGKPCPEVDGFLVSATALHKPAISDACNIENYVDSLLTPALVIPKSPSQGNLSEFAKRNARVGDLVVAMRPEATEPVYAVVGDTGPTGELGEGSIALNGKLLEKTALPVNYQEVRGKGEFAGRGWTVPPTMVLIFPGTRDQTAPFMTSDRIDQAAKAHFDRWGGVDRMKACASAYSQPD